MTLTSATPTTQAVVNHHLERFTALDLPGVVADYAPDAVLPEKLHWSMWESYSTWLTGFALFTVMYLFNAGTFLIDKSVHDWSPAAAVSA